MKPEYDTVPNAPPPDATDPGEARVRASERKTDPTPARRRAEDLTIPDPVDVERLILSLDRKPSPPAPMPEERPSSDGGRFVAYRGSNRPVAPTPDETRRKALSELSVMVNATPVPSQGDGRTASTGRLQRRPRSGTRSQVIWALVAVALTLAAVVSVIAVTTRSPSSAVVLSSPAALVVAPTAATLAPSAPSRVFLPPLETSAPLAAPAPPPSPDPRVPERVNPPPASRAPSAQALAPPAPATPAAAPATSPSAPVVSPVPAQAIVRPGAASLAPSASSSLPPDPSRSIGKSAFDRW